MGSNRDREIETGKEAASAALVKNAQLRRLTWLLWVHCWAGLVKRPSPVSSFPGMWGFLGF